MGFFFSAKPKGDIRDNSMKVILNFIVIGLLFLPAMGYAEVKEITSDGDYNMGDGETPLVAESRARVNAERNAIEQAGVYIESYSKVKNFQLTHDEIRVLASGLMEVTILEKKRAVVGDAIKFSVRIKALVSTDKVEQMAKRVKEKSVLDDYMRIQEAYDKSQKEIEALRKELASAKSAQGKDEIKAKIVKDERLFQANEWFEKGYYYAMNKEDDKAVDAYTKAIDLTPALAVAYGNRSFAYSTLGDYQKALADANKAIEIDPRLKLAYYSRGVANHHLGNRQQAIDDCNTAAKLGYETAQDFLRSQGIESATNQVEKREERPIASLPPAPPLAIATEREVEVRQFFESYVKGYNEKDLEGLVASFSSKAIQNQRDDLGRIKKSYQTFFDQMETVQYRITIDKIEPQQNSIRVSGQYQLEGIPLKGRTKENWKGQVRWVLVREDGVLKILTLDYQPQK